MQAKDNDGRNSQKYSWMRSHPPIPHTDPRLHHRAWCSRRTFGLVIKAISYDEHELGCPPMEHVYKVHVVANVVSCLPRQLCELASTLLRCKTLLGIDGQKPALLNLHQRVKICTPSLWCHMTDRVFNFFFCCNARVDLLVVLKERR